MGTYNDDTLRQKNLVLQKLKGEARKEYYVAVFTSHLVASLRKARKSLGINQKEIARRTGLKQSYISKIENLEKNPTIETIAKYCFALNFTFDVIEAFENDLSLETTDIPVFSFCSLGDYSKINGYPVRMVL